MVAKSEISTPIEIPMPPLRFGGDIREMLPKEGREIQPIQHLFIISGGGEMDVRALTASQEMDIPEISLGYTKETENTLGVRTAKAMAAAGKNVNLVYLGEGEPRSTFGNEDLLVNVTTRIGADAVYSGYGPTAENAHFVQRLEQAGKRFIGPTSEAMTQLGDKAELKQLTQSDALKAFGIPTIPGSPALTTLEEAIEWGEKLGYPLLIKMSKEGGGRGIFEIYNEADLISYFNVLTERQARSQSLQGYNGLGEMIIEKLIQNAKHVEIQVASDGEDARAIGARECSAQIDREKVVEISPPLPTTISEEKLEELKRYSVALTKAAKYKGLVTIEWLVDENGDVYLMEANTRIQVEHTLNQILNGFDYVQLQLALEEGYGLPEEIKELPNLVVMQVRLSARDPFEKFAARYGPIDIVFPEESEHLRIDAACGSVSDGQPPYVVPQGYNPLQAKYVAVGRTLEEVIAIHTKALDNTRKSPGSPATNEVFLRWLINTPEFRRGEITTTSVWPAWDKEVINLREILEEMKKQLRSSARLYGGEDILKVYPAIATSEVKESVLKKPDVLVFRHGEDIQPQLRLNMTYDEFREYIYHPNSPLSQKGREQIIASLNQITPEELAKIECIFTSNIRRARQSAGVIKAYIQAKTGNIIEIEESSYLAEVTLTADILPEEEYKQLLKDNDGDPTEAALEIYRRWEKGDELLDESHRETFRLINDFLNLLNNRMREKLSDGKAIVMTHSLILRALQYKMMNGSIDNNGRFNYDLLMKTKSFDNGDFLGLKREVKEEEEEDGHQLLVPRKIFKIIEKPLSPDTSSELAETVVFYPNGNQPQAPQDSVWSGRGPTIGNMLKRIAGHREGRFIRPRKNPRW